MARSELLMDMRRMQHKQEPRSPGSFAAPHSTAPAPQLPVPRFDFAGESNAAHPDTPGFADPRGAVDGARRLARYRASTFLVAAGVGFLLTRAFRR